MNVRKHTVVAASLVLAAAASPAYAGDHHPGHRSGHDGHHPHHHGHWHHGHHGDHGGGDPDTVSQVVALDGPRGVDTLGRRRTLVTEADGTFSLVVERRHADPKVIVLGSVPPGAVAPAISAGHHGEVYVLTGGGPPGGVPGPGGATLYVWHWGEDAPTPVFDVAAYQQGDPDPDNLADEPTETNPFGVVALKDGTVLIADAAGNDLIRWWPDGTAVTVARLKPRLVTVPDTFPPDDPELPPPGTAIPSEAVATSVTVGPDGYWYVGELRGFPATPGTSEIWRIRPGSVNAVCDPEQASPRRGRHWSGPRCTRYADGLTSIVDLGADRSSVYAVTLSKQSWFALEGGAPGAEIGGLFRVTSWHGRVRVTELVPDQLMLPGGVDLDDDDIYVTGPIFGPGALSRID